MSRIVKSKPRLPHPPEWGPWEYRPQAFDPAYVRKVAGGQHVAWAKGLVLAALNQVYSVQGRTVETDEFGDVLHLIIRRHDNDTQVSWWDLQVIKSDLAGANRVAIQVFPQDVDIVDDANLYHLWVLPEGVTLSFGLHK